MRFGDSLFLIRLFLILQLNGKLQTAKTKNQTRCECFCRWSCSGWPVVLQLYLAQDIRVGETCVWEDVSMNTRRPLLWVCALLIPPIVLYGMYKFSSGPSLYAGDRLETRPCRRCAVLGQNEECEACDGKHEVQVILPGPQHPTTVYADVFEEKIRYPKAPPGFVVRWIPIPGQTTFLTPRPGAVEGALLVFKGPRGETVQETSGSTGHCNVKLAPGSYTLQAKKEGFKDYEKTIEIPVLTKPLWQEKGETDPSVGYEYARDKGPEAAEGCDSMELEIGLQR